MRRKRILLAATAALLMAGSAAAQPAGRPGGFTLEQALSYPFITGVVTARRADAIAWVRIVKGVRNIWFARAPDFTPRQITHETADDGQEITWLTLTDDGSRIVYVRGGDHDANWRADRNLPPDPTSSPTESVEAVWSVDAAGGAPVMISPGDAPAISSDGKLAFIRDDQAWTAPIAAGGKAERLFFDHGEVGQLAWSPNGRRLAFVSNRKDHALVGVYSDPTTPILWLAPSTGRDSSPKWSPDGSRIAFTRRPGLGGPPESIDVQRPQPWSIWTVDARDGTGREIWASPKTLDGSFPDTDGDANLHWAAGDRLVFMATLDGWSHMYSVPVAGGSPKLLTAGAFMVEHASLTRDRRALIFDANTGATAGDDDRRHLFVASVDGAGMRPLTSGAGLEWKPASAGDGEIAFIAADARAPAAVDMVSMTGADRRELAGQAIDFPGANFVVPREVSWTAPDGTRIEGQLFARPHAGAEPGVVFVHGGPSRQMLLGWHSMDYYCNAYAVNQYLAAHGFTVLSVNYRLGIGYGRAFHHPANAGPAGASEYQDVLSGARFLQAQARVDPTRIGIWGGSYGGFLTALALARNSDVFKAGVDMHGIHDWSGYLDRILGDPDRRYERGDWDQELKIAWESSPDAAIASWKSPVLLIQGDDDRNVPFHQTVDLASRLAAAGVRYEELVLPNEIHGFLRWGSWEKADATTVAFLSRELGARP